MTTITNNSGSSSRGKDNGGCQDELKQAYDTFAARAHSLRKRWETEHQVKCGFGPEKAV